MGKDLIQYLIHMCNTWFHVHLKSDYPWLFPCIRACFCLFSIVHRLFRSLDDGNKNEKVCSHSKQYTSHCLTSLFCANSLSTLHTHSHTRALRPALVHSFKLCTLRSHLSRFWHLFSFYFTLSLAVLKMAVHIRTWSEFQHLFYHGRNGVLGTHHQQCQKQSPVKSVTCHMPIIKPSILYAYAIIFLPVF